MPRSEPVSARRAVTACVTRHHTVRIRAALALAALTLLALTTPAGPAGAQQRDSARAGVTRPAPPAAQRARRDTLGPPISARRAFFYSFLFPGFGQSALNRPNAGALFLAVEIGAIAMTAKSAYDLRVARARARDSLITGFELDPVTGAPRVDTNGKPIVTYARNRYAGDRVRARRTHLEDWYAALAANHLLAGAEAFVSAQLWDLPDVLKFRALPRGGALISAELRW